MKTNKMRPVNFYQPRVPPFPNAVGLISFFGDFLSIGFHEYSTQITLKATLKVNAK